MGNPVMDRQVLVFFMLVVAFMLFILLGPFSLTGFSVLSSSVSGSAPAGGSEGAGWSASGLLDLIRMALPLNEPERSPRRSSAPPVKVSPPPELSELSSTTSQQDMNQVQAPAQSMEAAAAVAGSALRVQGAKRVKVDRKVEEDLSRSGEISVLVEVDLDSLRRQGFIPAASGSRAGSRGRVQSLFSDDEVKAARDHVKSQLQQAMRARVQGGLTSGVSAVEKGFDRLPVMEVRLDQAGLEALKTLEGVKEVHADRVMRISLAESLPLIRAPQVWGTVVAGAPVTGAGQTVCVLDTGIDLMHPAFAGRLVQGFNVVQNTPFPLDAHGHGTHVAGIIAAAAPGATLMPIKVCASDGTCKSSDVMAGIDFCLNASAQGMVNLSAVSGSFGDGGIYDSNASCPTTIDAALFAARNASVVSVFASGNDGSVSGVAYPACSPYALSVGAADKAGAIAGFSNRGPLLDLLAPGVSINSTLPGGSSGSRSGTSMAAPFVSGAVALIKQYAFMSGLTAGPLRVEQSLMQGGSTGTGWPLLNAHGAMLAFPFIPESGEVIPPPQPPSPGETQFEILANPAVARVNLTPTRPNATMAVACTWNYTDSDADPENGTTWTWFINDTPAYNISGLVSYWRLDGNGIDVTGRNNGTINNSVQNVSAGVVKGALFFNASPGGFFGMGNRSYIATGRDNVSTGNRTVLFWVRHDLTDSSTAERIVSARNDSATNNANWEVLFTPSTGRIEMTHSGQTSNPAATLVNYSGRWFHIGLTGSTDLSAGNFSVYVNGELRNATSALMMTTDTNVPLLIGMQAESSGAVNFNGSLDEIKLFNRVLSRDEVYYDYEMMYYGSTEKDRNGTLAPDLPLAAWHFDDNASSTSVFDFFGDNMARVSNATEVQGVFGTKGYSFNGTNAVLAANHSPSLNRSGNLTLIAWMSSNDPANVGYLASKHAQGGFSSYGILLNSSVASCVVSNASDNRSASSTVNVADNNFHHVACTYNDTALAIYVDGPIRNWTPSIGALNISTNSFLVGSLGGTSLFFNGTVDEVELYDRAFSAEEINQSFRRSYPLFGLNYSTYGANSSITCQIEPIQMDGSAGTAVNSSTATSTMDPVNPAASRVNITPFPVNYTHTPAGVWNYSDDNQDAENGSTYTWFVNNTEGWRDRSLLSYWRFDGDAVDVLGEHNGSIAGATNSTGIIKSSLAVNGQTQLIGLPSYSPFAGKNFTIGFWMRPRTVGQTQMVFYYGGVNRDNNVDIYFHGANSIGLFTDDSTWLYDQFCCSGTPGNFSRKGEWHHLTAVFDNGYGALYYDGIKVGEENQSAPTGSMDGNTVRQIGSNNATSVGATVDYNGSIDEFKIWNRSLSAAEIWYEYQMMWYGSTEKQPDNGTPAQDIPVALWHFEDNQTAGTRAYDYFGDLQALVSNATQVPGVYGGLGFSFNGTNNWLEVNHSAALNLSGNLTWMLWMSSSDGNSSGYALSKYWGPNVGFGTGPSFGILKGGPNPACVIMNSSSQNQTTGHATKSIVDGVFHHIACTLNSTTLAMYVDGTFNSSVVFTGGINNTNGTLYIGRGGPSASPDYFNGSIDEVEIYSRVLTNVEINRSYLRSYPVFGINKSALGRNDSITFQLEPIQYNGTAGTPVNSTALTTTPSFENPVASRVNITPYYLNTSISSAGVWNYSDANVDPENGSTWTWFINNSESWRDNSLVGFWMLDGGGFDSSTRQNNATITSSTNLSNGGIIKGAFQMSGTQNDDSIHMGDVLDDVFTASSATFSIVLWVRGNGSSTQQQWFVSKWADGLVSENQRQFFLGTRNSNYPVNITFGWTGSLLAGVASVWHTTAFNMQPAAWTHVVVTYNGSLARFNRTTIYVNGLIDPAPNDTTQSVGTPTSIPDGTASLAIGAAENTARTASAYNLNGIIDEVRIYNRTITSDEVANLYQMMDRGSGEKVPQERTPAPNIPAAVWHFDQNDTAQTSFDFFGDHDAVISNATRVQGVFGTQGFSFNGTNMYVYANHSPSLNLSNFTVIVWMKTDDTNNIGYVISKVFSVNGVQPSYGISLNRTRAVCHALNATGNITAVSGVNVADNAWHQVACVQNATSLAVYVDGLVRNATGTVGVVNVSSQSLWIGRSGASSGDQYYNGTLDELEIYNVPFSAEEINQSFRRSFPLFGLNRSVLGVNSSITFQIEPMQHDGTAGSAVNSSTFTTGGGAALSYAPNATPVNITPISLNRTLSPAGVWNYTDADGDVENGSTYTWFINNTEGWRDASLVGYWRLDENAIDATRQYNGTVQNDVSNSTGLIKSAFWFNGSNGFVNVTEGPSAIRENMTVMAWIKTPSEENYKFVISSRQSGGGEEGIDLMINPTSESGTVTFQTDVGGSTPYRTGTVNVRDNKWHHIVGVRDSSILHTYVDGRLDDATSSNASGFINTTTSMLIGKTPNNLNDVASRRFNGTIDEVKIFNRSLTTAEIANEYQMMLYGSTEKGPQTGTPAPDIPAALWHFDDEPPMSSAFDFFGDSMAVRSNATRTQGVFGTTGMSFNGTNSLLAANHTPQLNQTGNFTVLLWMLSNDGANVGYLVSKQSASVFPTYAVRLNNSVASCQVSNATDNQTASSTVNVADGVFHHVACTYNTTSLAIYIDGLSRNSTPSIGLLNSSTNALLIGSQTGTAGFFNGTIDELEIYNRPFTAEEINQSFRRSFPLFGINKSFFGRNASLTFQVEAIQYNGTAGGARNSSTLGVNISTGCRSLVSSFTMEENLTQSDDASCFVITGNGVVIDCGTYYVTGNQTTKSLINATNVAGLTVQSCRFQNASLAIDLVNVSGLYITNSTFGGTAIRIVANRSSASNVTISYSSNISNISLLFVTNATIENNSLQVLEVNSSGPITMLRESNRYVNNTIFDGRMIINDSGFRLSNNIISNVTPFVITGAGGLIWTNDIRNSTLNWSSLDAGRNSRILNNSFAFNATVNGQCLHVLGPTGYNLTIANNTFLQCGLSLLAGSSGNSSLRDNKIDINLTSGSRPAAVDIIDASDVYIRNLTMYLNHSPNGITDAIRLLASRNITISNSTILVAALNQSGAGIVINASNYTLVSELVITVFNKTIEISGDALHTNTRITENRLSGRNPDVTPCILVGRTASDRVNATIIRGNVFNCTAAITVSGGSSLLTADINISDNRVLNGTTIVGSSFVVHNARFSNNSVASQRGARAALELINLTSMFVVNNTFANTTGGLWVYPDAENVTVMDNFFANMSLGINATGGVGLFIWNATMLNGTNTSVVNPLLLINAFNATVNNTWFPPFVVIGSAAHGHINFTAGVNFTVNTTLVFLLNVSNNSVYINSTRFPELNGSAFVRLLGNPFTNPRARVANDSFEFRICPTSRCFNSSYDGDSLVFVFNVSQFSGYQGVSDAAPRVVNGTRNNTIYNQNTWVNISVNVTDESNAVDTVLANVSIPNGSVFVATFARSSVYDLFNATFNQTSLAGEYIVRFIANDTSSNVNATETINFSIAGLPVAVEPVAVSCSQTATINDQIICAAHVRWPNNGSALPGVIVFYNVTNETSNLVATGNATDIGAGNYRINFSVPAQGGYVVFVAQNGTAFGAATATMVRAGFSEPSVSATGTLFFPEDRIVVDAVFLSTDGVPLRQAGCNLTLVDQNLSVILQNITMPELDLAGISHYVYNTTNITVISNMTEGAFFGHVRCSASGSTGGTAFTKVGFEVRRFNQSSSSSVDLTSVLDSINDTREILRNLLNRQGEFSQEEVFLVTDAFNAMSELSGELLSGTLSPPEALSRLTSINETISLKLGERYQRVSPKPLAQPSAEAHPPVSIVDLRSQSPVKVWLDRLLVVAILAVVVFLLSRSPKR